jgi:amino acid transporter
MKKIVIICGSIAGLIVTSIMLASIAGCFSGSDFEGSIGSMLLGYSSMVVAFSLIFVGVKNYRDKHNDRTISFGKALKIGLLITLVASTIYVIVWQIDYYFFIPDFYEKYSAHIIRNMQAHGATQAQIQQQMVVNKSNGEMYRNPLFNAMFTYIEILPVGIIMSLLAALILKRKSNPDGIIATASLG